MRRLAIVFTILLAAGQLRAQDFSNKGKEFWLTYSYHVGMSGGGNPTMTLYITSDVACTYTVDIYSLTPITLQSGSIAAGQVITCNIPTSYFVNDEGLFDGRAIHVKATKPVVVYSYITRSAASGATVALPVNVLGKEYYSMNFEQVSNEGNSNSYFTIVATKDNTVVEITPAAATKGGWSAGTTYTVNLNRGQVYQVLGTTSGNNGTDLTGSRIRSVGTCNKIAVFSGSGKIRIPGAGCASNSSDNLYQQLYPVVTWGQNYLTAPSYNRPNNYYRIIRCSPAANVWLNGTPIPASAFTGNYYQFKNNIPNQITSDTLISVAQYFTTQNCEGNSGIYDPDMIVLNPVEQNIKKVTLVSSNLFAAGTHEHHLQAVIKNAGAALDSFRLDGNLVGVAGWSTHPANPAYSYRYFNNVGQGYHTLSSDSGFNGLAYGYANAESYGYSAGANVVDRFQFCTVGNTLGDPTLTFAAACKGTPFCLYVTLPYQPLQLEWQFYGLFPNIIQPAPVYDSTYNIDGRPVYRYKANCNFVVNTAGTYPITVTATIPPNDGCTGEQDIDFDLEVFDKPVADFDWTHTGCITDTVYFRENSTVTGGRPVYKWRWSYHDGGIDSVKTPKKLYAAPGTFDVKLQIITDVGCLSDTLPKSISISSLPLAGYAMNTPVCVNKPLTVTTSATIGVGTLAKWVYDWGDGSPVDTLFTNASIQHTYTTAGSKTLRHRVISTTGCNSRDSLQTIMVHAPPLAAFVPPANVCLPAGTAAFTNTTTIGDGTLPQVTYVWNFGDGSPTATTVNPAHNYSGSGPYSVLLTATSNNGCVDDTTIQLTNIWPQPNAGFNSSPEVCLSDSLQFTDNSTPNGGAVIEYFWDFGDGSPISTLQNPKHKWNTAGPKTVRHWIRTDKGCYSDTLPKTITVNRLPTADFTIAAPYCVRRDVTFTSTSTPNDGVLTNWRWNLGDGTTQNMTNGNPFTHTYNAVGPYTVTLEVETDKGCKSDPVRTQVVTIRDTAVVDYSLPEICLDDPTAQFFDSSKIVDGTQAQFTYLWNFGDPNANAGNPNTSTLKNPTHSYTAAASYNMWLEVTTVHGCKSRKDTVFTVNGSTPVAGFTVQNTGPLCSNKEIEIQNASTVNFGVVTKLEIYWDWTNNPGLKTTDNDPTPGKLYNFDYPDFGTPASRTVTIRVVAYSGTLCSDPDQKIITLLASPNVVFGNVPELCLENPALQLIQASETTGATGIGVFSGPGVSLSGNFDPAAAGVGTHVIRYTYTTAGGCADFREMPVTVNPTPDVTAGPDRVALQGGSVTLLGASTTAGVSYTWTPPTKLSGTTIAQPSASPDDDITYTVTAVSAKGCKASDQVVVKVLKGPRIPNVFTPNGDGVNDLWSIEYLDTYPGCVVEVYNRYGQRVYRNVGYGKPWDGKFNGNPLPVGTYYYIIEPKNGRQPITGYVDIVR